jgi:general secretion pathway protein E
VSGFAEELAAFYGCDRVQRGDLVGSRFLGAQLSPRFLRERRLFPFETSSGSPILAIAAPPDGEAVRAVELALQRSVSLAVATAEDIEAALGTTLEAEEPRAVAGEAAASEDNLDDLRDLPAGRRSSAPSTSSSGSPSNSVRPTSTSSLSRPDFRSGCASTACSRPSRRPR